MQWKEYLKKVLIKT